MHQDKKDLMLLMTYLNNVKKDLPKILGIACPKISDSSLTSLYTFITGIRSTSGTGLISVVSGMIRY